MGPGIRKRTLKIQSKTRINRWSTTTAPEIKLCGNWLEEFGFTEGKKVIITASKGVLTIKLEAD